MTAYEVGYRIGEGLKKIGAVLLVLGLGAVLLFVGTIKMAKEEQRRSHRVGRGR